MSPVLCPVIKTESELLRSIENIDEGDATDRSNFAVLISQNLTVRSLPAEISCL